MGNERLKKIPAVELVRQAPVVRSLIEKYPDELVNRAIRDTLSALRQRLSADDGCDLPEVDGKYSVDALGQRVADAVGELLRPSLRPVVNATGVAVHTNLGRSPLSLSVWKRMERIATGYSNLEYDLERGQRGERHGHVEKVLRLLTGAESALVVNNNAAAVLLVLSALARGREVVVSRGELIEIGGSFRLPDIMAQGGAILREVGATNRTRISDYAAAVGSATGLLMKAHRSNYAVTGFVDEASRGELAALAGRQGIPFFEDLGSGQVGDPGATGLGAQDVVSAVVAAGVDIVSFSGDKLMGGPQAGIIVGRKALLDRIRKHPMLRALRPDKVVIAGVEATCACYLDGSAVQEVPVQRMLSESRESLRKRALALAEALAGIPGLECRVAETRARVGGGALPEVTVPSWGVVLAHARMSETALEELLRRGPIPVIGTVEGGRVRLDVLAMSESDISCVADALRG
jgi:L-seryl-tRNA(Ser) seleniumtransferase